MEQVAIDGIKFKVVLERNNERKFSIEVLRGKAIRVSAPDFADLSAIEERILRKKNWILAQDKSIQGLPLVLPERKFVSGESVYILGEQYFLDVLEAECDSVQINGRRVVIKCNHRSSKENYTQWLTDYSDEYLEDMFVKCLNKFQIKLEIQVHPRLAIRKLKNRWGSCSPNNLITLNLELIAAKPAHIEYVIFHELTHLIHLDHSKEFFEKLALVCPDYQTRKIALDMETQLFKN
jgi:predicted metal-dependent hydrolase